GINNMEMMVNYALTGKMDGYDLSMDNPVFNKYCCTLNLVSEGGIIGEVVGLDNILKNKNIIHVEKRYNVGDKIEKTGTLRHVIMRIHIIEDNIEKLINSIKQIQNNIKVYDENGFPMLLPLFDTDKLFIYK
uniref:hypothetical protein n=1 Tax=uncultured Clostridium sp. TaxID=59620 RepID=UPI0028EFABAE